MNRFLIFFLTIFIILSCGKSKEHFTDAGFRYILHTDSSGKKPLKGDYVTIELVCHTDDSVLLDTRKAGNPFRFRLESFPFSGCYEEDLTYIGVGDSATFFVSADSLFKYLFHRDGKDALPQEKTLLKKGTFVKYEVKLLNVQDYVAAEQEMQMHYSAMEKKEKQLLAEFLTRNKITAKPDSSGLIKVVGNTGKGPGVDSTKIITVFFRGRLIDGTVFGATEKNKPFQFMLNDENIIKGWRSALKDARAGDVFTIIVPSRLAYGEEGLLNPSTGKFAVPPYATLIFDIVVAGADLPASALK